MIVNFFIALLSGFFSALITHWLGRKKSIEDKKREIKVEYLMSAWKRLECASNRQNKIYNADFESAIADIQLLGSHKQIDLAQQIAIKLSQEGECNSLELLLELREDLRKELGVAPAFRTFKFLRFEE